MDTHLTFLANVQQHHSLLTHTDNMHILYGFAETSLMAVEDTEKLQGIYLNYQAESKRHALQREKLVLDMDAQQQLNIAE